MNGTIDYSVLENEQLAKLESGSRANVLFKPSKRMKKRRQLDALVSNGKKLPRRKQSGHELLRSNDSDSSEVEEFSVLESPKWGKRLSSPGCCSTCYTLACILFVALCLLACAVLIWMHLQLKHDFNQLKDRVDLVENKNAGTPEEFQALQSKLLSVNKTVGNLRTGKHGLEDLNRTIVIMQKQITSLTAEATELQKTVQASEPSNKENLAVANTVAELGANLQLTQNAVETLKTSQKSFVTQLEALAGRVSALENPGGREGASSDTDFPSVQALLSELNATFSRSIGLTIANLNRQQTHLDAVDQFSQDLDKQLKNVSQAVVNLTQSQQQLADLLASQQDSHQETESGNIEKSETRVDISVKQLQSQMDHLQLVMDQMQSDLKNWTTTRKVLDSTETVNSLDVQSVVKDHEDLLVFKAEVFQDLNSFNSSLDQMNVSVDVLNKDVEELYIKLAVAMSDISNITAVVQGLTAILQNQRDNKQASHSEPDLSLTTKEPAEKESLAQDSEQASEVMPKEKDSENLEEEGKSDVESSSRHAEKESESEHEELSEKSEEQLSDKATRTIDKEQKTESLGPGTLP